MDDFGEDLFSILDAEDSLGFKELINELRGEEGFDGIIEDLGGFFRSDFLSIQSLFENVHHFTAHIDD